MCAQGRMLSRITPTLAYRRATQRSALAAGGIVFGALMLGPLVGQFLYGLDLTRIDAALLCAARERLQSGQGLWLSPLLENGGPLLARPDAELLYPPRWIALLLPIDWGVAFSVAFHLAVAAAGITWLTRTFGAKPFTAASIGIAFAFSGTALDLIRHAHYISGGAWLPVTWAASRRSVRPRATRFDVGAVFGGLAGCLLGGEPQAFAIAFGLVTIEVALALARTRGRAFRRAALTLGAAGAGFALGLSQWLLTLGELALTRRSGNLPIAEALQWSFAPLLWLGTAVPGVPLAPVEPHTNLWQISAHAIGASPWNAGPYVGPLFALAVLGGLLLRRGRVAAVVFGVALLFALGEHTPFLPALMRLLPPLARFRYPAKYLVVTFAAASVLAALAFDRIASSRKARHAFSIAGVAVIAVLLGAWALVGAHASEFNSVARAMRPEGTRTWGELPTLSEALRLSLLQALAPLALGMAVLSAARFRKRIAALAALDVIAASAYVLCLGDSLIPLRSPLSRLRTNAVRQESVLCTQPRFSSLVFPLGGRIEWGQALWARQHLLPEIQACDGVTSATSYSPLESAIGGSLVSAFDRSSLAAARALGCTHLILESPSHDGATRELSPFPIETAPIPELSARNYGIAVEELLDPIPAAFFVQEPKLFHVEADVLAAVESARSAVEATRVIDDPLRRLAPERSLPGGRGVTGARVQWLQADRARLVLDGSGPALAGLRTSYLVGWRAYQREAELPVLRSAGNQVAALVSDASAGPIEFVYRAPNRGTSVAAALVGVALGAAMLAASGRSRTPRA